jgi:hypothetical protein
MTDKQGDVVTTSITNLDIHDLARASLTFGVEPFFLVHPVPTQHAFARKVLDHWTEGWGSTYNVTRKEALSIVRLAADLGEVADQLEAVHPGQIARFIATTARRHPNALTFQALRERLASEPEVPYCLVFGTGWGLHPLVFEDMDAVLEPIQGSGDWNHLSVRAAAAIILDRILGR